jgi:hypothetical protein
MARLQGLAGSSSLQQADLSSDNTRKLLHEMYLQINNITTADRLFILNKNDIVMINLVPKGQKTFVDINVSNIDWVRETRTQHKPVFSNGFEGRDGKFRIAITYPIINSETGKYIGLVGALIPDIELFSHYGNIYNISSNFLVASCFVVIFTNAISVLSKYGNIICSSSSSSLNKIPRNIP